MARLDARTLVQGETYTDTLQIRDDANDPIDLSTGYTAVFQIREGSVDSGATALVDLDEAAGVTLANGSVSIRIEASATRTAVAATDANVLWAELDLTETASGNVSSYVWKLEVQREYAV